MTGAEIERVLGEVYALPKTDRQGKAAIASQ